MSVMMARASPSRVGTRTLYPCGVIANSMFNDVITLENEDIYDAGEQFRVGERPPQEVRAARGFRMVDTTADISGCLGVISTTDAAGTETSIHPRDARLVSRVRLPG